MTAATGRADYDNTVSLATLQADEPIFVIRGRDLVGADAVRAWANFAHRAGAPIEAIELALQQADRLEAWPNKKAPDGPDLSESQRKQLRYEHSRRAWNARTRMPGEEMLLAVQLGRSEVMGKVRPLVIQLLEAILREGLKPADLGAVHDALAALVAFAGYDVERLNPQPAQEAAD